MRSSPAPLRPAALTRYAPLVALALLPSAPRTAAAQARDTAGAEKLYEDGMKLRKAGDWVQSCQRFDMSFQLDPAAGTQLQRATCAEREGKLALAWARFREARTLASDAKSEKQRQGIEAFAASAIARLETKLPFLTVVVAPVAEGTVISRDGTPMPVGIEIPVDPGAHNLEISAPGYVVARRTVSLAEGKHERVTLTLERLNTLPPEPPKPVEPPPEPPKPVEPPPEPPKPVEPPPEPPKAVEPPPEPPKSAPPAPAPASEGLTALQWTGIAVGGVGLVSLIGSGITGAAASGEVAELDAVCPPVDGARLCPQSALNDAQFIAERGQNLATISTVTTFAGLGLAATGTLLFLLGGDDEPASTTAASVRFAPVFGPGVAGLTLGGTFR